jgi:hypothetical protein
MATKKKYDIRKTSGEYIELKKQKFIPKNRWKI